jgi:hypothetical protein
MARQEMVGAERRRLAMEQLIEAVERGDIEALEDLTREEVSLLLSRARPGESLEDLFDRLRQPRRDRD